MIDISVGRSRKDTLWARKSLAWGELAERLSKTVRTNETAAEYAAMTRDRQDDVKDVGGFVGGTLTDGHRRSGHVAERSLITLDVDEAESGVFTDFKLLYGNAACCYSTHKHTAEKPRLRIVIPLSRPLSADEYEPAARRIAGELGINQFDDSTFEPERLMYWPSTSKDAEFMYDVSEGEFMDADALLNTYTDWRDSSEWPVSDRQKAVVRREMKKLGDPAEKTGVVGAFCRTYDVYGAIEKYLSDVYTPTDDKDRYTYVKGSTSKGLIVYENGAFAYSHHGTDPAGGRTLNAFDLVRLHLYGDLDTDVTPTTNITKYPSYTAMTDLALKDDAVKRGMADEKLREAGDDFRDVAPEDTAWMESLDTDRKGNYLPSYRNIELIMKSDSKLKGCFAFNDFCGKRCVLRRPPWRDAGDSERFIRDDDEDNLRIYIGKEPYGIEAKQKIDDVLNSVCRANAFHPIREYLDNLKWDGVKRLETLFIDFLGAEDTPLNREMTRIMFTAAVERIYRPGTKFDQMLILVGNQGCGKSEILKRMSVNEEWFTDAMPSPELLKEASDHLQGKWIVEMGELVAMKKSTAEANKSFLSRTSDKYRAAYAKNETYRPRQCVFFGTTNEQQFLRDYTGERRYWPMQCSVRKDVRRIDAELTRGLIDMLWAEAKTYRDEGRSLSLPRDMQITVTESQEEFKEDDEWAGIIEEYLNVRLPANWLVMGTEQRRDYFLGDEDRTRPAGTVTRDKVCIAEIINECPYLNIRGGISQSERNKISSLMHKMTGWTCVKSTCRFGPYGTQKYFQRTDFNKN